MNTPDVTAQPEPPTAVRSSDLLGIDREMLLTSIYLGVQRSLYAQDFPETKVVLPGMHICHYHQNTQFQMRVDHIAESVFAAIQEKMPNTKLTQAN